MRGALVGLLLSIAPACANRFPIDRADTLGSVRSGVDLHRVPVLGWEATVTDDAGVTTRGELLAVDETSVWVLGLDGRAIAIPRSRVARVAIRDHGWVPADHVATLFQFARFPQGMPAYAPVVVRPIGEIPEPPGEIPPPPGDVPPAPGGDAPDAEPAESTPPPVEAEPPSQPAAVESAPPAEGPGGLTAPSPAR